MSEMILVMSRSVDTDLYIPTRCEMWYYYIPYSTRLIENSVIQTTVIFFHSDAIAKFISHTVIAWL